MKALKKYIALALLVPFVAGPATALADTAKVEKAKPYPLTTCVVSGEKLGGMGKGYTFVQDGQEVKLCCKDCLKDFKKDPAKYMKKIAAAAAKAKK